MRKHYTDEEWKARQAEILEAIIERDCAGISDRVQRIVCEGTRGQYVPAYPGQWPMWVMIPVVIVFFVVAALILMSAVLGFAA